MRIENETGVIWLVKQAQCGNSEAMSQLSQQVADRVLPYIRGLTLNYDLAEDILQETLLELVKSLDRVKSPESFWCWVYRLVLGKVQHHFRDRSRQRSITLRVANSILSQTTDESLTGLNYVMRMELSEIVLKAMDKLKIEYRNVLILRCFENLSYAEIAQMLDCKELRARVLFLRQKIAWKTSGPRRLRQRIYSGRLSIVQNTHQAERGLFGNNPGLSQRSGGGHVCCNHKSGIFKSRTTGDFFGDLIYGLCNNKVGSLRCWDSGSRFVCAFLGVVGDPVSSITPLLEL